MTASPRIALRNAQRAVRVNSARLRRFAEIALPACLRARGSEPGILAALPMVEIALVSDRRIAELHRKFLSVAGPTDVITFQHGEIVISTETAARHAREFGSTAEGELELYVVHGLLHLQGFDDHEPTSRKRMHAAQRRIARAARAALARAATR